MSIRLDLFWVVGTMARPNQGKQKYEKTYLSFHRGSLLCHSCIAGIDILRAKGGRSFEGRSNCAAAQPYTATEDQNPTYSARRGAEGERNQEGQLTFEDSKNSTDQSHSSAD